MPIVNMTKTDDMFASSANILVNPVNCIGVSGAGLAKVFAIRFPENERAYREYCERGLLHEGEITGNYENGVTVLNAATKHHWRNNSTLEGVLSCLGHIREYMKCQPPSHTIAVPALGCGCGKLSWFLVKKMSEEVLGELPHIVLLYPPK